jgi:murein DD-endopeptidase MepM/ murein hydrolase activator NlpD
VLYYLEMQIEITVPRPGVTLLAVIAVAGWAMALHPSASPSATTASVITHTAEANVVRGNPVGTVEHTVDNTVVAPSVQHDHSDEDVVQLPATSSVPAIGGDDATVQLRQQMGEWRVLQAREEQQVLQNKQEIIRSQLDALQQQRRALGSQIDPKLEEQFSQGVRMLVGLLDDQKRSDDFLRTALSQVWEAQGKMTALSTGDVSHVLLSWPVAALQGVSAYFKDPAYKKMFRMEHYAIDIPTPQGSKVRAAASGTVRDVVDHGLGFNYITIEHDEGYVTLYGHLSAFSVKPGDSVFAGTVIGDSGGLPGSKGAGMSTGPHVHFALYVKGAPIDPLPYLPKL